MVALLKPQAEEQIYDPFCGTGGMLVECLRAIRSRRPQGEPAAARPPQEGRLYGMELTEASRIARMNMILCGARQDSIAKGNSLRTLGQVRDKFDVVITNIPFSQSTDYGSQYPVPTTNGDSACVQHCLESLNSAPHARAAIIVPIGFLHKTEKEIRATRAFILNHYTLDAVVELNPYVFLPYTAQHTAILLVRAKHTRSRGFSYLAVKNDGFSANAYRIPIAGKTDLDQALAGEFTREISYQEAESNHCRFKQLLFNGSRNDWRLGDIAEIQGGYMLSPNKQPQWFQPEGLPFVMVDDLARQHISFELTETTHRLIAQAPLKFRGLKLVPKHSILLASSGASILKNHRALLGRAAYLSSTVTAVSCKTEEVHPFFLFGFFLHYRMENILYDLGYPGVSKSDLQRIRIPKTSPAEQQEIAERYNRLSY